MLKEKIESAKRVLTISDFNKKYLTNLYGQVAGEKVSVVRCGIDVSTFNFNGNLERKAQVKTIIAVGRLCDIKGFEYLVKAIHILIDETSNKNLHCVIVGEGENRNKLVKLINRLKLNDFVELPGAFSQEKLQKLLKEGDVFVLPSIVTGNGNKDGIPVVLMEAMATGIPVVTTDVSGLPEIAIDMKTALVVPPRDAKGLAVAIERMLKDKELASQLRENARKLVEERYNIRINASELVKCFF
jgi:glycosyltransferase involved in cell wall biosynthesis